MNRVHHAWLVAAVATFAAAPAQQTWIVDGGYAGGLTTMHEAFQRANDGDTILVRYASGFRIDWGLVLTKGVTIIGDSFAPRAGVVGNLVIAGLAAHQRVVLRSLEPDLNNDPYTAQVTVQDCAGGVVLDDVVLSSETPVSWSLGTGLSVHDSAHVALHRCQILGGPGLDVGGSAVTCTASMIRGRAGGRFTGVCFEGVVATNSRMWFADSTCRGGGGLDYWAGPSRSGLVLRGSLAMVAGTAFTGGNPLRPAASIDLDAGSWLFHDTACSIDTWLAGATSNLTLAESGRISGGLVDVATPAVFTLDAGPGIVGLLAAALPGPEVATPVGSLWLFEPTVTLLAAGTLPVSGTVILPATAPRGTVVALQGATIDGGKVMLSTPVLTAAR